METIRVRFAPSPTGFLHIGGVRTALFNWLYARRHRGKFLLRIEDTDLERSEKQYTDDILASLKWLGLNWDEEPLHQSHRLEVYKQEAESLVKKGLAYVCTCTEAQVEAMREKAIAQGKKPQYDGSCREKGLAIQGAGPFFVVRAKLPHQGAVEFDDLIRGPIRFENADLDDFVLIRSNGAPTYNLSVVVDDAFSRVTHVIRGDDHINNTPKQIHLYRALGLAEPRFAHLAMILGPDKKKLSKRHGAVSANVYRGEGYLPEAMLNFLVRLGWSHGDDEVFTPTQLQELFSLEHVQKSSAVFNSEKLLWLNGVHLRTAQPERLADIIQEDYGDYFAPEALRRLKTQTGLKLVGLVQPKVKLLQEFADQLVGLLTEELQPADTSGLKWNKEASLKPVLQSAVHAVVEGLKKRVAANPANGTLGEEWQRQPSLEQHSVSVSEVEQFLRQVSDQSGVKIGDLVQPMRLALTGKLVSPSLFDLMAVLPWKWVETRLEKVAHW